MDTGGNGIGDHRQCALRGWDAYMGHTTVTFQTASPQRLVEPVVVRCGKLLHQDQCAAVLSAIECQLYPNVLMGHLDRYRVQRVVYGRLFFVLAVDLPPH